MDKYNVGRVKWMNTPAKIKREIKAAHKAGAVIEFYRDLEAAWVRCDPWWIVSTAYRVRPEVVADKPTVKEKTPKVCIVDEYNKGELAWKDTPYAVKHKIKDAYKAGLQIEYYSNIGGWNPARTPAWTTTTPYRVKPGPARRKARPKAKPDTCTSFNIPITICGKPATLVIPWEASIALCNGLEVSTGTGQVPGND